MSRHPSMKWAQMSDKLFITVELPDTQDVKLKLEPEGKFSFSATSGVDKIPYEVELDLLDKVNVDESKANIGLRNICYLVKKAERKWWSRLLKQKGKPPVFLTVDWDKWVEEEEEIAKRLGAPPGMEFDFDFTATSLREDLIRAAASSDADSDDSDTEEDSMGDAHPHSAEEEAAASGIEKLDIKKT